MSESPTLDEHPVRALLARAGVTAPVQRLLRRTAGRLSTVYEAELSGGDAVVVKIYQPQWAWKQAKEIHVYGLLADRVPELAGRIPRILGTATDPNPTGHCYTVLTSIPGTPLAEVDPRLTPAQRYRIYQQIGQLLRAVHRVPMGGFGYLVTELLDPAHSNQAYMQRRFDAKLREFAEAGGAGDLVRAIERAVLAHEHVLAVPVEPVLCHNDMHEGNVLVERVGDTWTVRGFVDVENAVAADPVLDLAKTDYYSVHDDTAKRAGLLAGWRSGGTELPDDLDARLRIYRIFHALELWDWFAETGEPQHLPGIAADLRALTGP